MYGLSRVIFNHGLEFQDYIYNGCHDLIMVSINISSIAISAVKGVDYRCIIYVISNSEAIHLLEKYLLEDRGYI